MDLFKEAETPTDRVKEEIALSEHLSKRDDGLWEVDYGVWDMRLESYRILYTHENIESVAYLRAEMATSMLERTIDVVLNNWKNEKEKKDGKST